MIGPKLRVVTLVVATSALVACSGSTSKKDDATANTTGATTAAATTATTPSGGTVPVSTGAVDQVGPGDFVLLDPQAGLEALSSYGATLTVSFEGSDNGKDTKWWSTSLLKHTADPSMVELTIENSGDLAAADPGYLAESAGLAFVRDQAGQCTNTPADPQASLIAALAPAAQLSGIVGAESLGDKQINAIDSTGYRFDERAVGLAGIAKTSGEVWVAAQGGYVLQYTMTIEAGAGYFGDGIEGSMSWTYELTDVNAALAIDLPPECGGALLDAPIPTDATNVARVASSLSFTTGSTPNDVIAFYQQHGKDAGWVSGGEPTTGDKGAAIEFTIGDQRITIVVQPSDAGSTVIMVAGPNDDGGATDTPPSGSTAGQATITMTGGHTANFTWQFAPEFSMLAGGTLTFDDPANPLPAGPFLTLVLDSDNSNLSYSDAAVTITAGAGSCTFTIDHQDSSGAAGTIACAGVSVIGGGVVDINITFSAGS